MFRLRVDLGLCFTPPMPHDHRGVVVTREFELPFAPWDGLALYEAEETEVATTPVGYMLREVTWDLDGRVFLAQSESGLLGYPMQEIPSRIRDHLAKGWRLGSMMEDYGAGSFPPRPRPRGRPVRALPITDDIIDLEEIHTLPPRRRPKAYNILIKALVRYLAENMLDRRTAYAMDRSGLYFEKHELEHAGRDDPVTRKWNGLRQDFDNLSSEEESAWIDSTARYPSITDFVLLDDKTAG